jgi:hypothetical protein
MKVKKRRKDNVVQGYHVKPRKLVDVLGLPNLSWLSQLDKNELSRRYPISISKGTLLYQGPKLINPAASGFKGMFGEDEVKIMEKKLYHVAHMKDLFKHGKHIKIFNRSGQITREAILTDKGVRLDPKSGNPADIFTIFPEADLLYEPWWLDVGSFLFVAPNTAAVSVRGRLLKLGVEDDTVVQVQ